MMRSRNLPESTGLEGKGCSEQRKVALAAKGEGKRGHQENLPVLVSCVPIQQKSLLGAPLTRMVIALARSSRGRRGVAGPLSSWFVRQGGGVALHYSMCMEWPAGEGDALCEPLL